MIGNLLKLLIIVVLGILIYNYFMGSDSEKEGAKKIFGEVKDVGVAVKDLLKSEKQKFDAGKYDKALDKIEDMLAKLKRTAKDGEEHLDKIEELERKREALERELAEYSEEAEKLPDEFSSKGGSSDGGTDSSQIKRDMNDLLRETERLIQEMEADKQ
ncbi:MAG: hypothetical protein AAB316_06245 [Bacteroidota bacterium]